MLNRRDDIGIWRSISVDALRALLEQLDGDDKIVVNDIGNLLIFEGKNGDEDKWRGLGYIDVTEEKYEKNAP
jgi:hypothetical protein